MTNHWANAQDLFWAFNEKFSWVEDGVPGPQFNGIAAVLRTAVQAYRQDPNGEAMVDFMLALAQELETAELERDH